jgi:hypothetical protein
MEDVLDVKTDNEKIISGKPYVGLWKGLGRTAFQFWQLIAELIDNTMTVDGKTNCKVTIDIPNKQIIITDDSIGIAGKDLVEVISMGKRVNEGKQLFSFSGIGMKPAICSLGNEFYIQTKPRCEDNMVYILKPKFTLNDPDGKIAEFSVESKKCDITPYGTTIVINDIKIYPKTITSFNSMIRYIGATYADYLEYGDLKITVKYIQTSNITREEVKPVRPLLSNKNNIIDSNLMLGQNEPEFKNVSLKGDGWEVLVSAGRKAYPETAREYYLSKESKLYNDVYGVESSPYGWSYRTSGVQFKTQGIGKDVTKGKILLFHELIASSRAESFWCEVSLVSGIEPGMIKSTLNETTENYQNMIKSLDNWLKDRGFRQRAKSGMLHYSENKEVRDKWVSSLKEDVKLITAYGINLNKFKQQVSTETYLPIGKPDVFIESDIRTIVVECKKEEIKSIDVSQAAGYAVESNADSIILVGQGISTCGSKAQEMWSTKLQIPIIFDPIQKHYID